MFAASDGVGISPTTVITAVVCIRGGHVARKSLSDLKSGDALVKQAIEEFKDKSEMKQEMAKEAYDAQDEKTQAAIDVMLKTLQQHATGYITVQLTPPHGAVVPVKVDAKYLTYNLFWLAMETAKNLAILGIRLESFVFPEALCVQCGAEIIPEQKKVKRGGRV